MQSLGSSLLVAAEYLPAEHGSGAAAPAGQYDPGSHALHAVFAVSSWYVPPAHGVQLPLSVGGHVGVTSEHETGHDSTSRAICAAVLMP